MSGILHVGERKSAIIEKENTEKIRLYDKNKQDRRQWRQEVDSVYVFL